MHKSAWFVAAEAVAGVVLVLLILDPTRDLGPVLCLLALAVGLFGVGTWRASRGVLRDGLQAAPGRRKSRRQKQRERAAALRAQGLPFTKIGRRLGISKQAAWRLLTRYPVLGVHCSACHAVVTTRDFPIRTLGPALCGGCLAARPDTPFSLRLRSHRFAAGMSRSELEAAASLRAGAIKNF
jgi:hypothetical protein